MESRDQLQRSQPGGGRQQLGHFTQCVQVFLGARAEGIQCLSAIARNGDLAVQIHAPCGLAVPACESRSAAARGIAGRRISDTQPPLRTATMPCSPERWPARNASREVDCRCSRGSRFTASGTQQARAGQRRCIRQRSAWKIVVRRSGQRLRKLVVQSGRFGLRRKPQLRNSQRSGAGGGAIYPGRKHRTRRTFAINLQLVRLEFLPIPESLPAADVENTRSAE